MIDKKRVGYIDGVPHYAGCELGTLKENSEAKCNCKMPKKVFIEYLLKYKKTDLCILTTEIKKLEHVLDKELKKAKK